MLFEQSVYIWRHNDRKKYGKEATVRSSYIAPSETFLRAKQMYRCSLFSFIMKLMVLGITTTYHIVCNSFNVVFSYQFR